MDNLQNNSAPINWIFRENGKLSISPEQYNLLRRIIQPYEEMSKILNSIRDKAITEKNLVPVYEKDLVKTPLTNEDGTSKKNEQGEDMFSFDLKPDFWEQFNPKPKPQILDLEGNPMKVGETKQIITN